MERQHLSLEIIAGIEECFPTLGEAYNALQLDMCWGTFYRAMTGERVSDETCQAIRSAYVLARAGALSQLAQLTGEEKRKIILRHGSYQQACEKLGWFKNPRKILDGALVPTAVLDAVKKCLQTE